jgi:drug/metabolite transporter (DMT)-like permease
MTTHQTIRPSDLWLLVLLGFLSAIPYALTKIALTTIPPITMVAARVTLAAVALWLVLFTKNYKWPQRRGIIPRLCIQGCLACAVPYTLLAFGQRSVDSALTAILNSTTPIFVFVISLLWTRHEPLTFNRLFGLVAGLAGVIVVAGVGSLSDLGQAIFGQAAILTATAVSAGSIIHGRKFADVAAEITAAGSLTAAAIVLVPLCFIVEEPLRATPSLASIAALAVNALLATAFGSVVYFRLIRTVGSVGTASAGYLKLAFGVLVGGTLMGEALSWATVGGLLAIVVGVASINLRQPWTSWHLASRFAARAA